MMTILIWAAVLAVSSVAWMTTMICLVSVLGAALFVWASYFKFIDVVEVVDVDQPSTV